MVYDIIFKKYYVIKCGLCLQKVTPEVSQLQLDAHYIQYLQWAFLESRAKKAFKGQEKHIMVGRAMPNKAPKSDWVK